MAGNKDNDNKPNEESGAKPLKPVKSGSKGTSKAKSKAKKSGKATKPKKALNPVKSKKKAISKKPSKKTKGKKSKSPINPLPTFKNKGVKYIDAVLKKHYKTYSTDKELRRKKAKEILEELKSRGLKVNVKNIRLVHKDLGGVKGKKEVEEPFLNPSLDGKLWPYWDIDNPTDGLLREVSLMEPEIRVVSDYLFPKGFYLQGGKNYSLTESKLNYFIKFCDKIRATLPDDSYGVFVSLDVLLHDAKKDGKGNYIKDEKGNYIWEIELRVVDSENQNYDVDYNYDEYSKQIGTVGEVPKPKKEKGKEKPQAPEIPFPEEKPAPVVDVVKEAEAKAIQKKSELDLLISKKNSLLESKKSAMEDVKMWKEFGPDFKSELAESIVKLKNIIAQIEKLDNQITNFN